MKRLLAILMVLLTVSAVAACTPQAPAEAPQAPAAEQPAQQPAAEQPAAGGTIGVSLYARDQFISNLEQAILKAAEGSGYTVDSQEANNDTQKQQEQVRTFALKGYDAIIVNLVDTSTAETIISEAGDTPIIFINRRPVDELLKEGKYAYVGSQEYDAGKMQAEFLAKFFAGKADKTLNYVLFMGQLGLENTNERTRSVKEELTKAGFTMNKVFEDTAEWDRSKAMDKMQTIIGTGEAFDVVICNNDEMALGCIEAMKAAGIDLKAIPVVGIDATAMACESVKNGEMAATVFQNAAAQGQVAMEYAIKAAKGETFDIFGWVPFEPVSIDNVANYM
ncbi:MAG TPA: substrate-binding domain-containing protein [Feifaniaceae bacterium]|nr:substrate-binding domain-containing protein [Feifaniaceae bacterium]